MVRMIKLTFLKGRQAMIEKMNTMNQIVPTQLAVKVDGKSEVRYRELPDCFGYEFEVFPKMEAREAVEQIVSVMESQSYDHGAEWRWISFEEVQKEDELNMFRYFVVKFRIRDSY